MSRAIRRTMRALWHSRRNSPCPVPPTAACKCGTTWSLLLYMNGRFCGPTQLRVSDTSVANSGWRRKLKAVMGVYLITARDRRPNLDRLLPQPSPAASLRTTSLVRTNVRPGSSPDVQQARVGCPLVAISGPMSMDTNVRLSNERYQRRRWGREPGEDNPCVRNACTIGVRKAIENWTWKIRSYPAQEPSRHSSPLVFGFGHRLFQCLTTRTPSSTRCSRSRS